VLFDSLVLIKYVRYLS